MLNIVLVTVGMLLGFWWWKVIVLPLFYGVPKAFYYVLKGLLKKSAILFYLLSFLLWTFFIILIAILLGKFFPKVSNTLLASRTFANGQLLGIGVAVVYMFSKKGRADLNADFWDAMFEKNFFNIHDPSFKEKINTNKHLEAALYRQFIDRYGEQAPEKLMEYLNDLEKQ